MSLDIIVKRAEAYAAARAVLSEKVTALTSGIADLKRQLVPAIKKAVAKTAEAEAELRAEIEANPDDFIKPKTHVFNGVRVGYMKAKGTLDYEDADAVIARIRKHFPDQADVLIKTKESPAKDALALLPAGDLKKLGVTVTSDGDQVVIKPVDGEVDKMVDALLKDATEEKAS
jgi:hypothetical protein